MLPLPANFRRVRSQQSMAAVNKKRLSLQKSPHKVMNVHKDSRLIGPVVCEDGRITHSYTKTNTNA